ncbi:DUF6099 family protein [Streptomyces sp. NPDC006923]|uniref:DUF6099 family protein n=1 Tax=Streptomyces sp. NPDC006923 TaxID=3155355 RepID=UPI0033F86DBC
MDAERLIGLSRHALTGSAEALDVIAEAWQAQALAQVIGNQLVQTGPQELKGEARELSEAGGRGCGLPDQPGPGSAGIRARRLSGVADPRSALTGLGELLGEVGIALVALACETDEEGLYWQCIEAIDAADESNDRVGAMLRRLVAMDRESERARERAQREPRERGQARDGPPGALRR